MGVANNKQTINSIFLILAADIRSIRVAPTHDNVVVSSGRNSIRVWRLKDGSLRSSPVDLASFRDPADIFTTVCFPAPPAGSRQVMFVCSKTEHSVMPSATLLLIYYQCSQSLRLFLSRRCT